MSCNVVKMLRTYLVRAISAFDENKITEINESDITLMSFCQRAVDEVKHQLTQQGYSEVVSNNKWNNNEHLHNVRSLLGNAEKMLTDLRGDAPTAADRGKLTFWNTKWKAESAKAKRAKDLSGASTLPKRLKSVQNAATMPGSSTSSSGIDAIVRTLKNHQCSPVVGVPYDAIRLGKYIGEGSFGSCREVTFEGVSYFPPEITYCAKKYKGSNNSKLGQFQREQGMQKVNASLVRCIAFTTEPPWITVFPIFNGGTINDILFFIPYKDSSFRPVAEKLARGEMNFRPSSDRTPTQSELARLKGFVDNTLNIMHALIDGMKTVHSAGIIHCDLHAKNIVLDFTRDNVARIGIIDWGLLLIIGMFRPSLEWVLGVEKEGHAVLEERRRKGEAKQRKKPWLAPEICDPLCQDAYSKESDVYALGWLFRCLIEFWKVSQRIYYNCIPSEHPEYRKIWLLEEKVNRRMVIEDKRMRISMAELNEFMKEQCQTEPARAQRPLIELGPTLA